jgi:hypothetical protein
MTAPTSGQPKRPRVSFHPSTEDQAEELRAAWQEILSGKRTRLDTAAEEIDEITQRAMIGLQRIVKAVEEHPGSGQAECLVRFLAGVYNGNEFNFDLTDLRALDPEFANACVDYLNYDRLSKAEVHTHLPDGGRQMELWINQHGILPRLHLSSYEEHEQRLYALSLRLDRERDVLLKEALGDLLARYESKVFGGLLATQPPPEDDQPLVHARFLRESVEKPLCGAPDGPWGARAFSFDRVTCRDCKDELLSPRDDVTQG